MESRRRRLRRPPVPIHETQAESNVLAVDSPFMSARLPNSRNLLLRTLPVAPPRTTRHGLVIGPATEA
jgi:hypothetical protein